MQMEDSSQLALPHWHSQWHTFDCFAALRQVDCATPPPLNPEGQHAIDAIELLGKDLKKLWNSGERSRNEFAKVLKRHGEIAAKKGAVMSAQQTALASKMADQINELQTQDFITAYIDNSDVRHVKPWLVNAACDSNLEALLFLLRQGHDPNERSLDSTATSALCAACSGAFVEGTQALLTAGARIDEDLDHNPLLSAILGRSLECAKLLVERGIDIHKIYTLQDGRLRNALEFAERWGCPDIAEYLRSKGAVLPSDRQGTDKAAPKDRVLTVLANWFRSEKPKSLGSLGLGRDFGEAGLFWFDMTTADHPFLTVFTSGLSNHPVQTPAFSEAKSRIELMMHLPFTWQMEGDYSQMLEYQWPLSWLRLLPKNILDGTIPLPGNHVIISNDEPPRPLGQGTEQSCLLLIGDFYKCFPVAISETERVHFFHVVPLYTNERDFEKVNGMRPLLEAMATRGLDSLVVRPNREKFV